MLTRFAFTSPQTSMNASINVDVAAVRPAININKLIHSYIIGRALMENDKKKLTIKLKAVN